MITPASRAFQSDATTSWERFAAAADRVTPAFDAVTRDLPLVDSSVLFSDGLCVCALCELLAVDCIIESGTGFGGSTEMLAKYFTGRGPVKRIWSIDMATTRMQEWRIRLGLEARPPHVWSRGRKAAAVASERLARYPMVTLVRGDGTTEVPRLVRERTRAGDRIGVLIDGPKEQAQFDLAEALLRTFTSVRFVALDDIGPKFGDGRLERFSSSAYAAFSTSDPEFVERFRWIDRDRLPSYMRAVPGHTGYGLGVMVPRE